MGTPERFYQTEQDINSGIVEKKNLSYKQKLYFRQGWYIKQI